MRQTDRQIKTLTKQLGAQGNRLGEFLLAQSGETMEIRNDDQFNPQTC